jgi:hypothetical protein
VDFSKLKMSDWVIAVSGIVLFIASFLDWFTIELDFGLGLGSAGEVGANGWDVGFFWAGVPAIIGLAMVAVVAIKAFSPDTKLPDLPVGWGQAMFIAGCVAAAIVLLKLLLGEDPSEFVKRAIGLYLAAIAALGLAAGGFLKWQEEKGGVGGGTTTGDGPAAPF